MQNALIGAFLPPERKRVPEHFSYSGVFRYNPKSIITGEVS